jgi:hypothetical protein
MANLTVHFQTEEGVDRAALGGEIQQQLSTIPTVQAANVEVEQYRAVGPAEIMAGITLAIGAVNTTSQAITAITKFVNSVSELVKAGKGLREAIIDVGMRKVPVSQLTQADIEKLAARTVSGP